MRTYDQWKTTDVIAEWWEPANENDGLPTDDEMESEAVTADDLDKLEAEELRSEKR